MQQGNRHCTANIRNTRAHSSRRWRIRKRRNRNVNQQIDLRRICLLDRLSTGCMLLLTSEDSQQILQGIAIAQAVQAGHFTPAGELQTVGFSALGDFTAGFPEQLQQLV